MEALAGLGNVLWTIFAGLLMFTVLVIVHELGHYWAAKACGMQVKAFAIMMGGVRKTDLTPYLKRPLLPRRYVAIVALTGVVLAMVGAGADWRWLYTTGLALAGVVVPQWVILRLAVLYHVTVMRVAQTLLICVAIGFVVLLYGTRFKGVSPEMVVGVLSGATIIALLFVYYLPIQQRQKDDEEQGHGEITAPVTRRTDDHDRSGEPVYVEQPESIPVRFRPVWCKTDKHGTEFSLLLLPLGGFAAMKGMHARPDGSEVNVESGFYSKHPWKRLIVLFAGPFFSVLFGILLLFGLYSSIGKKVPVNEPVLGEVPAEGQAYTAGLRKGDRIVAINGKQVATFYDVIESVKDQWKTDVDGARQPIPIEVKFDRGTGVQAVTVVPSVDTEPLPVRGPDLELREEKAIHARLGVLYGLKTEALSVQEAATQAVYEPVRMVGSVVALFTRPSQAKENLSGPTFMAQATNAAVRDGAATFIWFAAMLSLSLGIMNLLPIVPMDGGQMVVAFIELFRGGRRISFSLQNLLANGGMAFLVLLMLFATATDLGRNAKSNQDAAAKAAKSTTKQ